MQNKLIMKRLILFHALWFGLIGLIGIYPLRAEQTLTFPQAFDLARQHNLELQAIDKEVKVAEGDVVQASLIPNPTLDLEQRSNSFPGFTEGEQSLLVSEELELGGKRGARLSVVRKSLEIAKLNQANTLRQLRQQVRTQFFKAWIAQERVKVLQDIWQAQSQFLELSEKGFKEGQFPGAEIDLLKAETLRVEQKLDEVQSEAQVSRTNLAPLLGLSPNEIPTLEADANDIPAIPDLKALLARAEERPDLKSQQATAEEARKKVALENALAIPNLTVGAGVVQEKVTISGNEVMPPNVFSSIQHQEGLFQVRFSLPLPLFNRNQGNIEKANRLYESARLREENLRKVIQSEITSIWQSVIAEKKINNRFTQNLLPTVKTNSDRIKKAYLLGGESILAVIQARRTFLETELDYLDNLSALHASIALLESSVVGDWP